MENSITRFTIVTKEKTTLLGKTLRDYIIIDNNTGLKFNSFFSYKTEPEAEDKAGKTIERLNPTIIEMLFS